MKITCEIESMLYYSVREEYYILTSLITSNNLQDGMSITVYFSLWALYSIELSEKRT